MELEYVLLKKRVWRLFSTGCKEDTNNEHLCNLNMHCYVFCSILDLSGLFSASFKPSVPTHNPETYKSLKTTSFKHACWSKGLSVHLVICHSILDVWFINRYFFDAEHEKHEKECFGIFEWMDALRQHFNAGESGFVESLSGCDMR